MVGLVICKGKCPALLLALKSLMIGIVLAFGRNFVLL